MSRDQQQKHHGDKLVTREPVVTFFRLNERCQEVVLRCGPPRIDLPPATPLPDGIVRDGAGAWAVGAALVDASDPARVYVHVLEDRPSETRGAGIAAFELAPEGGGTWAWFTPDACPPGMATAIAATPRAVLCGARQLTAGTGAVRAVDRRDGHVLWDWHGITVDAIHAAGDTIIVLDGANAHVLDPDTGVERASWRATDGWLPRIALVHRHDLDGDDDVIVASYEHGHVVFRSAALALRPIRAIEVQGVLTGLFAVGDRVAATLTDGTAYLIDTRGVAVAAAGLAPGWDDSGDLAVATTTDATGRDGVIATFSTDGVMRVAATLPGSGPIAVAPRADVDGAPLTVLGGPGGSQITLLTPDASAAAVYQVPPDAPRTPVVATAVGGKGVVAAILARPLRLVRLDLK
jgi:hypothetical protein